MKFVLTLSLLLGVAQVEAAVTLNKEKIVRSKPHQVTVFFKGAQIARKGYVSMQPGVNKIVFTGLEPGIDARTLQASGKGNFVIMDVKHETKYQEPKPINAYNPKLIRYRKRLKSMQDSMVMIGFELEAMAQKRDALNTERNILLSNRAIKGNNANDTLPVLKEALAYLREQLDDIIITTIKVKKRERKFSDLKNDLQTRINEVQAYINELSQQRQPRQPDYRLVVTVSSEVAVSGWVSINYYLHSAGWVPSYDLRANDAIGPMQLTYKAQVYQSTGTDWNDVKLKLSTANPLQHNNRPVLSKWILDYYVAVKRMKDRARGARINSTEVLSNETVADEEIKEGLINTYAKKLPARSIADFTQQLQNVINMEYEIKLKYSIPSDGAQHYVAVKKEKLPATYRHYVVPKLDKDAFLMARVTDWDELDLIPGKANIYFNNTYMGETYIDPISAEDTMELTLGRDKSLIVKRKKMKDKVKEKVLLDEKVKTLAFEISLRNTKRKPVEIWVYDQIPVSLRKEIVVELTKKGKAKHEESTGILEWQLKIKPGETKKLNFAFEVTYPKNKRLGGL